MPETIASICGLDCCTIFPNAPSVPTVAQSVPDDPSCARRTITSASSLAGFPSDNWAATAFAAATGSVNCRPWIPAGATRLAVCCVTTPTKPTRMPPTSVVANDGSAWVPSAFSTFAAR